MPTTATHSSNFPALIEAGPTWVNARLRQDTPSVLVVGAASDCSSAPGRDYTRNDETALAEGGAP